MKTHSIIIFLVALFLSSCNGEKINYHNLIQINKVPKSVSVYSYSAKKENNGTWAKGLISENYPIIQYIFDDNQRLQEVKHYNHLKEMIMKGICTVNDNLLSIEFVDVLSDQVVSIEDYTFNESGISELIVFEADHSTIIRRANYKWDNGVLNTEEHELLQSGEYTNSYRTEYFYENGRISKERTVFSYEKKPDEIFNNNYLNSEYDRNENWVKRINPNSYNESIGSYQERVFKY